MMSDLYTSPSASASASPSPSPSPHKERGEIETKVPYETVKEAVTLFGERADLRNRIDWIEKRSPNGHGHYFLAEELRSLKERLDIAESEKANVLQELLEARNLVVEVTDKLSEALAAKEVSVKALEEVNLKLEEAENARIKEAEEKHLFWQDELEELKRKHSTVLLELESAKEEIKMLRLELQNVNNAKLVAENMVEEAKHCAAEALQKVEELRQDLSESKTAITAESQARQVAESARLSIEATREAELKSAVLAAEQAQKEIESLKKELPALKELESQVPAMNSRLEHSNTELAAMKETNCRLAAESDEASAKLDDAVRELEKTRIAAAATASKSELTHTELEAVKEMLQRSSAENFALNSTVESLTAELHSSKSEVRSLKETQAAIVSEAAEASAELNRVKEELALALASEQSAKDSIANLTQLLHQVSSEVDETSAELNRLKAELALALAAEKNAKDSIVDLTKSLQRASAEVDETKSLLEQGHEDLKKAKLETEQAKAMADTLESQLQAAYREAKTAKAAEEITSAELRGLMEKADAHIIDADTCPPTTHISEVDTCPTITIPKEEYEALKMKLEEADAVANQKVSAGLADLDIAKATEQGLLAKLEEAYTEIEATRRAEKQALQRAENAEAAKLAVESDLRKWRAENEQRRRAADAAAVDGAAAVQSPSHTSSAVTSIDTQERGQRVESLGQVLHIKFPLPADRVYPAEKQPSIKKRKKLLARIRSYLAKKRRSLKSFKDSHKGSTSARLNE